VSRVDFKELAFGAFLIALASVAFGATGGLTIGTAADMGPGFVPRALAWIILGFGATFLITGLAKARLLPSLPREQGREGSGQPAWRPLFAILASIALFAVLFAKLGLIAACVGAVVVAGAATSPVRWLQLIAFGLVMAAFSALLFVKGLGLPFRLWP
jgi:hypothetical protein